MLHLPYMKKFGLIYFLFLFLLDFGLVNASPITLRTIMEYMERKSATPKGEVSFNGKAQTVNCMSFTNLGKIVMPSDKNYTKLVCLTNPGKAKDSCFAEVKGAKTPVNSGNWVISTGQNNGGDSSTEPKLEKASLTKDEGTNKGVPIHSAKQEMQDGSPRTCCMEIKYYMGLPVCTKTIGDPVKQFGELKGDKNWGNVDKYHAPDPKLIPISI